MVVKGISKVLAYKKSLDDVVLSKGILVYDNADLSFRVSDGINTVAQLAKNRSGTFEYSELSNTPNLLLKADLVNGKVPSEQIPIEVLDGLLYDPDYDETTHTISIKVKGSDKLWVMDLPLESLVKDLEVIGTSIYLTLENGTVKEVAASALLNGLASEGYVDGVVGDLEDALATVAKSGKYDDLSGTPIIPEGVLVDGITIKEYEDNDVTKIRVSEELLSNGVFDFEGLSKVDSTHIKVGAGRGIVIEDDVVHKVEWQEFSSVEVLGVGQETQVYINKSGELVQVASVENTCIERREMIYLGKVVHSNGTGITNLGTVVDFNNNPTSQLRDLWRALGLINVGIEVKPKVPTGLELSLTGGRIFYNGINYHNNKKCPNRLYIDPVETLVWEYRTQTGQSKIASTVDVNYYDKDGVITAMPGGTQNNSWQNQRIFLAPNGNVLIQYGQNVYTTIEDAVRSVQSESFIIQPTIAANTILVGIMTVKKNASQLANAVFHPVSKFGEIVGGGASSSVSTLVRWNDVALGELNIEHDEDTLTINNVGINLRGGIEKSGSVYVQTGILGILLDVTVDYRYKGSVDPADILLDVKYYEYEGGLVEEQMPLPILLYFLGLGSLDLWDEMGVEIFNRGNIEKLATNNILSLTAHISLDDVSKLVLQVMGINMVTYIKDIYEQYGLVGYSIVSGMVGDLSGHSDRGSLVLEWGIGEQLVEGSRFDIIDDNQVKIAGEFTVVSFDGNTVYFTPDIPIGVEIKEGGWVFYKHYTNTIVAERGLVDIISIVVDGVSLDSSAYSVDGNNIVLGEYLVDVPYSLVYQMDKNIDINMSMVVTDIEFNTMNINHSIRLRDDIEKDSEVVVFRELQQGMVAYDLGIGMYDWDESTKEYFCRLDNLGISYDSEAIVWVAPYNTQDNIELYVDAGIVAVSQDDEGIIFRCKVIPSQYIQVNIVIAPSRV